MAGATGGLASRAVRKFGSLEAGLAVVDLRQDYRVLFIRIVLESCSPEEYGRAQARKEGL
jgi:hypothetical protein